MSRADFAPDAHRAGRGAPRGATSPADGTWSGPRFSLERWLGRAAGAIAAICCAYDRGPGRVAIIAYLKEVAAAKESPRPPPQPPELVAEGARLLRQYAFDGVVFTQGGLQLVYSATLAKQIEIEATRQTWVDAESQAFTWLSQQVSRVS